MALNDQVSRQLGFNTALVPSAPKDSIYYARRIQEEIISRRDPLEFHQAVGRELITFGPYSEATITEKKLKAR